MAVPHSIFCFRIIERENESLAAEHSKGASGGGRAATVGERQHPSSSKRKAPSRGSAAAKTAPAPAPAPAAAAAPSGIADKQGSVEQESLASVQPVVEGSPALKKKK